MTDAHTKPVRKHRADPALVVACLAGDGGAWGELVDRYAALVYSIAARAGVPATERDDVVQNVFLIALRRLDTLQDQTVLSSWLITTARRESWRVKRGLPEHAEIDEQFLDGADPLDDDMLRWERARQVHEALRGVDERCRTLLTALFLEGETPSYEVIARRLGMPIGSIGPVRARCFKKLERALLESGFEPDP